jgi:hypothetical protein
MHFTLLGKLLWGGAFFLNLALLFVLLTRTRRRQFPILTVWISFLVARSPVLFAAYLQGSAFWYTRLYEMGSWVDFALQLAVVLEIASIVLRPTGTWVRDARGYFATLGLVGVLMAALFAWWVSPPAQSARRVWEIRGNLFTSMVICELFIVMSFTANRLGLAWRSHVMAVGQGLTAWSTLMVVKTALQTFPGTQRIYTQLEEIRAVTYIAATCWMIVLLWRQEPERQRISPKLEEYILALHERVEYDLRRLEARR